MERRTFIQRSASSAFFAGTATTLYERAASKHVPQGLTTVFELGW